MVAHGHADAMVAGVTRNWTSVCKDVRRVIDAHDDRKVIGVSLALCRGRAVLIADTSVHDMPTAAELADIAVEAARAARNFGIEPRVALLAYSTFDSRARSAPTRCARRWRSSTSAAPISSTTATWRPTWRSTAT